MSLFSGLDKFGLGKLEKMDVFEEEKKEASEEKKGEGNKPKISEEELLFEKTYNCPVCDNKFHAKTVRNGKVKLLSQDTDLRPKYQTVDILKYDAIVCPKCGYAALSRFFKFMMPAQAKLIQENISSKFNGIQEGNVYTYDDAIERHQLALANSVVKKAKDSEKAYTCLKMAWLLRGKAENLPEDTEDRDKVIEELQKEELELLNNACDGLISAFENETFPVCGMDELTVTYLIADLARRTGRFDVSGRWISQVLTSREANERIKNRARDIRDLLEQDKKKAATK